MYHPICSRKDNADKLPFRINKKHNRPNFMRSLHRNWVTAFAYSATLLLATDCLASNELEPRAIAILQNVMDRRLEQHAFSMSYEHRINGEGSRWIRISTAPERLRIDVFGKKTMPTGSRESTVLLEPSYIWTYLGDKGDSLERSSHERLRRMTQYFVSPRAIGIVTFYSYYGDLDGFLHQGATSAKIVGESEKFGEPTVSIEVIRSGVMCRYEIAPKNGRLYKRVNYANYIPGESNIPESYMEATFADDSELDWMPSQVVTHNQQSGRTEVVKNINFSAAPPPPENFELYSLDIHKNAQVIDIDQKLQIGTWNGSRILGLSDTGTGVPDHNNLGYLVLLGLTTAGVLGAFWFLRNRSSRNLV